MARAGRSASSVPAAGAARGRRAVRVAVPLSPGTTPVRPRDAPGDAAARYDRPVLRRALAALALLGCAPPASATSDTGEAASTTSSTGAPASSDGSGSRGEDTTTTTGGSSTTAPTEGTAADSSSTTGAQPPIVTATLITDQNRHYPEMHGGWGPHLRGVMHDDRARRWFVADAGPSVEVNDAILYFRHDPDGWTAVGSQPHLPGVQQNAASVLHGATLHTFAVDVVGHQLEHCSFDLDLALGQGCEPVAIGGPYTTPPNSNYVGAALGPDPVHLVWFTVVGDAGGAGALVYTYDYGGGYNGPVATALPGYNDLGYVFASFRGPSEVVLAGQAFTGQYPTGSYDAVVVELTLGGTPAFTTLGDGDVDVRTAADVHVDLGSDATHVLAETDAGALAYYFKPGGAAWSDHLAPVSLLPDSFRGRFVAVEGAPLAVVRGSASDGGIEILRADGDADAPIAWAQAEAIAVPGLGEGFGAPSALYVPSRSVLDGAIDRLEFVACGAYGVADGLLWHVDVDVP